MAAARAVVLNAPMGREVVFAVVALDFNEGNEVAAASMATLRNNMCDNEMTILMKMRYDILKMTVSDSRLNKERRFANIKGQLE